MSCGARLGELGGMRSLLVTAIALSVHGFVCAAETGVDVGQLEAIARRAGLRVLESTHLVLATDRPVREGDGVDELPAVFDDAFEAWCRHYGMNPTDHRDWKCFGCLVVNRERFRAAGLLPDNLPPFENGFCDRNRFWLIDQSNPAYRRHLLLHEGVHAFTLTLRGLATPVWYNEGIAEFLATHRLDNGVDSQSTFVSMPIPQKPEDVEQLGRIEKIRELGTAAAMPALADVLAAPVGVHKSVAEYAASWAAVAMLSFHPAYAEGFLEIQRGPLDHDFNERLLSIPGWDAARAARDFDAFAADIDYGYDFPRMAIDWAPGNPLTAPRRIAVDAARGWQNSGCALERGRRYAFNATGRVVLGVAEDAVNKNVVTLEGEADGISFEWYRGKPTGKLLLGQWVETPADGGRPRFEVLTEGASGDVVAAVDGPLFMRLNGPPVRLNQRRGTISVTVRPDPVTE